MAGISEAGARRVQLVEHQLHEKETLDGLFEVDLDRVVAVTSERLMIVSGGDSRGWALTGIPWRLVTSVEFHAGEPDEVSKLEVKYTARVGRSVRKGDDLETEASCDICPNAEEDARRMADLMDAHLAIGRAID
jgi:hypothetical protein